MKKIFNGRGFLTDEGKKFVDEVFTKEVKKILATAQNSSDARIIGSLLSSIVGNEVADYCLTVKNEVKTVKQEIKQEKKETKQEIAAAKFRW